MDFSQEQRTTLTAIARSALQHGCAEGEVITPDMSHSDTILCGNWASFVTLSLEHRLRGCVGTLWAYRPLLLDVATNAYHAGFSDRRFAPVTVSELTNLKIEISVLSPPQKWPQIDEKQCMARLIPNHHGLILQRNNERATFLPKVWQKLRSPQQFLSALKRKIGWTENDWPEDLEVWVYTTQTW